MTEFGGKANRRRKKKKQRGLPSPEPVVAPLDPGRERPDRKRLSSSLAKIAERALVADEDDIRTFLPSEGHLRVAEAYLWGATSYAEVARLSGLPPSRVGILCRDPIFCGWMWKQVSRALQQRVGQVLSVVFQRALGGDMKAAQLILHHWGKKVSKSITVSTTLPFDPTKLSDEELDRVIATQTERSEERQD